MLPEKIFDTGEIVMNYIEGPKSGPTLVMLHGLTARHQAWEPYIQQFMSKWHVFACDLRGHGKSGRVSGQYRIVDYGRDIAAFLHGHFTKPVTLVGHSLGALTALNVACHAPEQVCALVLLDPPLFLRNMPLVAMTSAHGWFSFVHETLKSSPSFENILTICRQASPTADEIAVQDMADGIYHLDIDTVVTVLQDQLLAGWDLERGLKCITAPTLLMYGDWLHDAAMRDEDAVFVKAHLPNVVDIKIPNGSHLFPWEQTDITMEHIQNFLQSV